MMNINEVKRELGNTMIHLCLTGYSDDPAERKRVERMATGISYAISMLDELEELKKDQDKEAEP